MDVDDLYHLPQRNMLQSQAMIVCQFFLNQIWPELILADLDQRSDSTSYNHGL